MGVPLRMMVLLGASAGLAIVVAACGDDQGAPIETMPPIRTTTTTTIPTTPPTIRPRAYEIKQGESLTAVAERFGVTYLELARLNKIKNPDNVQAGQVIRIPPAPVKATTVTS